jgi:DNA-binding NarL/FixJ family response regulator
MAAHVAGFLLKDAPPSELGQAVRRVVAGQRVVDPQLALTVLREGLTNLLRHSKASYCRISARIEDDLVRLTIVNDGLVLGHHVPSSNSGRKLPTADALR